MPVIQTEICKDRLFAQDNRLVEALTASTTMGNIGTNRNATCAVLCNTDTEDGHFCGKLNTLRG